MPRKAFPLMAVLACGLCLSTTNRYGKAALPSCFPIYQDEAWTIAACSSDASVADTMAIRLDGADQSLPAARVEIAHVNEAGTAWPTVAVLYASGFVRLKQAMDPALPMPFGSSFVLGPAYWPDATTYHHSPQLTSLSLDTTSLPAGPLQMQAAGTNHDFDVTYELTLPPPRDRQTRVHVTQSYTATTNMTIDPVRRAEAQGFKLVQISSMFINEDGVCDGEQTACHDSSAARFIGTDLVRHQTAFADLSPSARIFSPAVPLGSTWLDALHTDDGSWQGNTPNGRIALDVLPYDHTITPQGWISATTNPDDDNIGIWLHDDGLASQAWAAGQADQISYWLLAQDNPPDPWADQGSRDGFTFLDFESSHNCFFVHDISQTVTGAVGAIPGYADTSLQLTYDLGSTDRDWAQVRCDFDPPLDISAYDHLRFDWRGDAGTGNSMEVGMIDQTGETQRIFARGFHHTTHHTWWGQLIVPFTFLAPWHGGTFDPTHVVAFFVSVVKAPVDDAGGAGSIAIDNLNAYSFLSRTTPADPTSRATDAYAATQAARWLASQQRPTGLLKSWAEELTCTAHTYDQALALIVFSHAGMWEEADAIVVVVALGSRAALPPASSNNLW